MRLRPTGVLRRSCWRTLDDVHDCGPVSPHPPVTHCSIGMVQFGRKVHRVGLNVAPALRV
jgi:hypothetical protein